jgi:lysophospholipase L1-like esterase
MRHRSPPFVAHCRESQAAMRICRVLLSCLLFGAAAVVAVAPPAAAAAPTGRPVKIMPLGDSITWGVGSPTNSGYRAPLWRRLVADAGLAVDFVGSQQSGTLADTDNEGHPGWKIAEIAANVDGWLAAYQPDVVLLHIGTNDINQNDNVPTAPDRLSSLIDQITRAVPDARVIVAAIVPTTDSERNAKTVAFNARIPGMVQAKAAAGKQVSYADLYNTMSPTSADFTDLLHPNDGGFAKMAANWYAALGPVLSDGRDWPQLRTGLEPGEDAITWTNTVEGALNVAGYCCGLTAMEAKPLAEQVRGGTSALLYSGTDTSASGSYSYARIFDTNIRIAANSVLSYWIYPQQRNGTFTALDMLMTDGSSLRDSGLVDQHGVRAHPQFQGEGGRLVVGRWNLVTVRLGPLAGRTIDRITLGYDQPAATGAFRGFVDDIAVVDRATPAAAPSSLVNLALKRPTSAGGSACGASETADRAADGVAAAGSKWCAGGAAISWQVDLGAPQPVSRVLVRHASSGGEWLTYNTRDLRIQTSTDATTWQTRATLSGSVDGVTDHRFPAVQARHVRLVVDAGTQNGQAAARIYEVEVYG